jgi:hypothetical protein
VIEQNPTLRDAPPEVRAELLKQLESQESGR